jgi:hypothetical protein
MKIRMVLVVLGAFALSGCETLNDAWNSVFGFNNGAPPAASQAAER